MTKYIVLGRITRPHGIKGECRVAFFGDHPDLLKGPLHMRRAPGQERPVQVTSWRPQNDQLVVALSGVTDRDQAEALRNAELVMAEEHMPALEGDELYLHQLLGLDVYQAGSGTLLGKLENVLFPAGQELWSIISPSGKEILFPAVPEYVDDIDLDAGRVVVNPPEGLLELYLD